MTEPAGELIADLDEDSHLRPLIHVRFQGSYSRQEMLDITDDLVLWLNNEARISNWICCASHDESTDRKSIVMDRNLIPSDNLIQNLYGLTKSMQNYLDFTSVY